MIKAVSPAKPNGQILNLFANGSAILVKLLYDSCLSLTTRGIGQNRGIRPTGRVAIRRNFRAFRVKGRDREHYKFEMPRFDFRATRLFVDAPLRAGQAIALDRDQSNYLGNVLRLSEGDTVLVFNGRDGEWQASITGRKRPDQLGVTSRTRPQEPLPDIVYAFAPLKHARLDYMVQKAVEMGASRLQPVLTRHTQVARVNCERMRANAIEAAEQCGILTLAEVSEPVPLERFLSGRPPGRLLVFCDESADVASPLQTLSQAHRASQEIDVLIGPEGGFAEEERALLLRQPQILRLSLGPRILRADTAAVAALALVQAALGDWTGARRD
jgi:16S rRNA (uracil1498-N3)-methyltransferase